MLCEMEIDIVDHSNGMWRVVFSAVVIKDSASSFRTYISDVISWFSSTRVYGKSFAFLLIFSTFSFAVEKGIEAEW